MNIKELVKYELPEFKGIIVADGAAHLDKLRHFGASVAWKFNKDSGKRFNKILIAGNIKDPLHYNKGKFFIADIKDIVSIRELAMIFDYSEIVNYQNANFGNWISRQISTKDHSQSLGIDERNAILFQNPTEIKAFSTSNFSFLSNPVTYII